MNFLGHLYFSNNDFELMYYNLFGDYVKGSDLSEFPPKVQYGLHLHRSIDDYIDHHPKVLELLHLLYGDLPKISGIAVDLFFDHLLASQWNKYHPTDLRTFVDDFYNFQPQHEAYFTDDFRFVLNKLKEQDWLYNYRTFEGLELTCKRLSKRISFENNLNEAPQIFIKRSKEINTTFHLYMQEAIPYFKQYNDQFLADQ